MRFVEVVVNGSKSWSLAAAMHSAIADAYDAAQDRTTHPDHPLACRAHDLDAVADRLDATAQTVRQDHCQGGWEGVRSSSR